MAGDSWGLSGRRQLDMRYNETAARVRKMKGLHIHRCEQN